MTCRSRNAAAFLLFWKEKLYGCNKSELIKAGVREGFRNRTSKYAGRRCYGYDITNDGFLMINPDEAKTVQWMFQRYLHGDSLGKIASGLVKQGILSPTGKPKWNREAIDKLLSNEKYTGSVLLQKTISLGGCQIRNNGFQDQYWYYENHEAIISSEIFRAVQNEKVRRGRK